MGRSHDPAEDRRRDLGELGRIYLQALASYDVRKHDSRLARLTASLGTILTVLGWHPDDSPALPSSGSEPAS
ncbi:MAG: hypothetical protein K2Y56_23950 [Methylobacterium sp.]|jgi:hypothetical protein|uniref:hypothetical protein n=1 Tax=Methylobacterium sp. TaxID=409 RepID=UPI0025D69FE2|nr:hypothetical protein [Methylobacterium sp.]MBX9934531.1 hypothetical protein [Methylobacterium sp.]